MACLLCKKSSDCLANEKEWSDSEGKRCRSSVTGEAGPLTKNCAVEADRDAEREDVPDIGSVDACCKGGGWNSPSSTISGVPREDGALLMRRRPEAGMPPS